ncbi:cilia- and flagella-associated protein 65-like isoform X2 [Coccinella septempunctata]|nr:cilia- and flagella-associated protein 65-like isoform X2 [Coccinella septempunctata]
MIDLVGICSKTTSHINELPNLAMYPSEAQTSYGAYFYDYGFAENKPLPFKFNKDCFDFGRVLPQYYGKSNQNNNIAVAILKNNMSCELSIKWYQDPDKVFRVQPNELIVKPDETGYFELSFNPDFRDHMYCRKMTAQIFWSSTPRPSTAASGDEFEGADNVPLEASLIMIGHSFPENQSWISAVEIIPTKVLFPVCLPGYQSFATFMLKSDGHLPVLFKFIPPTKSLITIKPMMGLMRFTKLFVAKLESLTTPAVYKEEWRIEINGESQRNFKVFFLGQSDVPSVVIGEHNSITFNTTLPGCQDMVYVPIKNTSCYHLRLDLIDKSEYFHVKPSVVELYPNEHLDTEWTFNAKLDVPHHTETHCTMRVISNNDQLIGFPFETPVYINARCEYSQICATPRYMDFGEIPWGVSREVEFKIFNFGKSAVCYILKTITVSGNYDDIRISNAMGKLKPNENNTIRVSFRTKTTGDHVTQIVYCTRINEFGEAQTSNPPVDLFSIKYSCIHPSVQIEECVEHSFGRIFSKLDMWNFFAINTINEKLADVKEGETKVVNLILPTIPCHEKGYCIRFVLRNVTKFDLKASLSRVKMCNCQITEISKSLSFRQKIFKCPHRNMLTMKLSDETIHGHSFQFLDILMNFNLITNEDVAYDLKLSTDRHLQLCFKMNSIPSDVQKLSIYNREKHKKFLNMFIGAKEPPYQTLWMYNYTSQETFFQVMDEELIALNEKEGFPVLSCLDNKGIVSPFSSKAILFRFHPIEAKKYQVTLPLILGSEKISLKFTGRGTYKYDHDLIHKLDRTIPRISMHVGDFPITLSADFIVVEPFSVWNTMEKLIYMRNISKDRVMEYTWKRSFLEGIIEIKADKSTGLLEPDEVVAILLKFQSFDIPAIATINMTCKILDITQGEIHEESLRKYRERQKQIDEYFMIDEKGTHTMENDFIIEPPSEEEYLTLAITFHTISTLELSHYLDVEQFFGQNPLESFESEIENLEIPLNIPLATNPVESEESDDTNNSFVSQILECFIMDTLRSPIFQELVHCQQRATPPYYIQFKQDEEKNKSKAKTDRIREMQKYFAKSPMRDLSDTFKLMIKDSVQQIFF